MKLQKTVKVLNPLGLHVRPASVIAKMLQTVESSVTLTYNDSTINAKSVIDILLLGAKQNTEITLTVEGVDADEVFQKLIYGFETEFEER